MTLLGIKVLRNRVILVYNKLNLEPKTVSTRNGNGIADIHLLTRDGTVRLYPSGANDNRNRDRFPNKGKDVRQRSNGEELLAKQRPRHSLAVSVMLKALVYQVPVPCARAKNV